MERIGIRMPDSRSFLDGLAQIKHDGRSGELIKCFLPEVLVISYSVSVSLVPSERKGMEVRGHEDMGSFRVRKEELMFCIAIL